MAISVSREIEEHPPPKFSQFEVVSDHSDHHFAKTNSVRNSFTNGSSTVDKKIMKEWKILEKDLPETIYVRVYENRIDLLRAVIVGPAGTPYHGGLFFFDIAFPSDYPTHPPLVHYKSFGLRLNPNLYECGDVCLSLLNTWHGQKNEKWNPTESTILQVLVSIQGLVLNDQPYFNEPGISRFPNRAKKSSAYSENVFVLSCQTMLYLLRRPPKNFEDFVRVHFREHAIDILKQCDAYLNGRARVGHYGENKSSSIKVSEKFKGAMEPMYEALLAAFTSNGASLGHFVEQLRVKTQTVSSNQVKLEKKEKKEKTGLSKATAIKGKRFDLGKIIGMIKKILGLRKNEGKSKSVEEQRQKVLA